jgi:TolA-binding protein
VSIATAIVGFCCSTIGLVAQYLEDFSGGNGNSLRGLREQLGQIAFEIAETEGEFQLLIAQNSFDNNLVSLVQRANTLVARLRQAEVLAGLSE